jgi:hypothetical protein
MSVPQAQLPSQKRPRSAVGVALLAGLLLFGVVGAACGYSGICETEYRTGPLCQAVLVAFAWGAPYGLLIGLGFGLIADWIRRS